MNKTKIPAMICAAGIVLLAGCAQEAATEPHGTVADESIRVESSEQEVDRYVRDTAATSSEQVTAAEILSAKLPGLLALSADEAAWLDRHGYPTTAELDALQAYDVKELSSAMRNRGDSKSAALLGHRRVSEGDISGALAAFSKGAHLGSLYARQQLAILSTHRATGLAIEDLAQADQGNLGVMVAQLEVARMLGDHRAQEVIDRYAVNFDWNSYGKHVLTQTTIFMDQYGKYAQSRGERIPGPDPRPNADAWKTLEEDPDALVTVYTRTRPHP